MNLDYCDFFECEIIELETEDEFVKINVGEKQAKGIILQIVDSGPDPKFVYPPIEITETNDYIIWKNKMINENPDTFNDDVVRQQGTYIPIYFFIEKYHNQRIKRSKEWFDNVKEDLKKTWKLVMFLQESPENFKKYKESIHMIKSKKFYELYDSTVCEINDDVSTFVFEEDDNDDDTKNKNAEQQNNNEPNIEKLEETICLID